MSEWKLWTSNPPPSGMKIEANFGPARMGYLGVIKDPRKFEAMMGSVRQVYWRELDGPAPVVEDELVTKEERGQIDG